MAKNWLQVPFETCPGGVSSAVAPELLPQSQFAWGQNIAIRGGKPHARPPFLERLVLPSGLHQSSAYFGVQGGMIVANIQGRIYRIRVGVNTFSYEEIPLGFINSGIIKQTWQQQTIESLVIQDGQSTPIIYNGSIARRAASNEVPRGTSMAYGNGRLWVAINEKELVAGDIRTRTPGSELKFTETNYLSGGGSLYFPRGITGLEFIPVTGAADFGTLIVFGRDYAESIRADVTSRDMWPQMAGFVTNVFRDIGCAGDWSIAQVNQDLYWRDSHGDIRSLANAISTNNSPGSTPISREVQRIVDFDSDQLLPWVSSIYFDNRLLMTASPYLNVSTGVSFKDIVSLDFSPISTMQLKASPAYDGTWTGIPGVAALVTGQFNGQNRAFAISSDQGGVNRLWEIMTRGVQDVALTCGSSIMDSPIVSSIEYPSINFGLQKERKRLERCDVWLSEIDGELDIKAYWRTDNAQQWTRWDEVTTCAKTSDPATTEPHVWKNLLPEQRPQIKSFTIPDGIDAVTRYGIQIGFEFQIRLVIQGKYQVEKMMLYATPLPDPDYANRDSLTLECIENNVTNNEVSYLIETCATPPPVCNPDFTFECRSRTGTATLCGYDEYTDASTPPKKYRVQTQGGGEVFTTYSVSDCSGAPFGQTVCDWWGSCFYDKDDCSFTNNGFGACDGVTPVPQCGTIGSSDPGRDLVVTRTTKTMVPTGLCFFNGLRYGRYDTVNQFVALSEEDTEADAIARMNADLDWSAWTEESQCDASYEERTGFSFDITEAQFRVTGTGITPGFQMNASVPIYRRPTGSGPYSLYQTRVYTVTANSLGTASFTDNVPNDAGFDSYAGTPMVTAQSCQ